METPPKVYLDDQEMTREGIHETNILLNLVKSKIARRGEDGYKRGRRATRRESQKKPKEEQERELRRVFTLYSTFRTPLCTSRTHFFHI